MVAPMFISEIAETSVRGTLGSFFQLFLTIGILFIYVVGAITNWIILSVGCAIFPILLIVVMIFVPESPVYLVKQVSLNGRKEMLIITKTVSFHRVEESTLV